MGFITLGMQMVFRWNKWYVPLDCFLWKKKQWMYFIENTLPRNRHTTNLHSIDFEFIDIILDRDGILYI